MSWKHVLTFVLFLTIAAGCSEATHTDYPAGPSDGLGGTATVPPQTKSTGSGIVTSADDLIVESRHPESWEGCPSQAELGMYDATDRSIHELITCGGMQVQLAQNMVGILIASNERMYDERTLRELEEAQDFIPQNPFERVDSRNWAVQMGPDSTFSMQFIDPTTREPITVDPFDMESYLVGLNATYELSFEEMQEYPDRKNRWEFTWEEPGPLAHLMNDGEPVPKSFVLELSLYQLVDVVFFGGEQSFGAEPADLGPFESILDIEMKSQVVLEDVRGVRMHDGSEDAVVRYDVGIQRQSVRKINAGSGLEFDLRTMTTTLEGRRMVATGSTLQYGAGGVGRLSGMIAFDTPNGGSVVADFGEGASYPEETWSCR